ncbi:hypothetical protein D3C85_1207700 [compost metagenome]
MRSARALIWRLRPTITLSSTPRDRSSAWYQRSHSLSSVFALARRSSAPALSWRIWPSRLPSTCCQWAETSRRSSLCWAFSSLSQPSRSPASSLRALSSSTSCLRAWERRSCTAASSLSFWLRRSSLRRWRSSRRPCDSLRATTSWRCSSSRAALASTRRASASCCWFCASCRASLASCRRWRSSCSLAAYSGVSRVVRSSCRPNRLSASRSASAGLRSARCSSAGWITLPRRASQPGCSRRRNSSRVCWPG